MKQLLFIPLLLSLMPLQAQTPSLDSPSPVSLETMKDQYRPLLIFTPSTTPAFRQQMRTLAPGIHDLHDRDVLLVPIILKPDTQSWGVTFSPASLGQMSPTDQASARARFHIAPNTFTVILLGLDGGEKLRSTKPVTLDQITRLIDSMPMRQQQVKERQLK